MTYVLDTNILLLDSHNLYTVGGKSSTVVIPETVLDEIDSKKSGLGELAYQAREFGRLMTAATYIGQTHKGSTTYINYSVKDTTVTIVALDEYPSYAGMEKNVLNDRKIIECALEYKKAVHHMEKVVFMTNDVACGIRAQSLGLESTQLAIVEDVKKEFLKEMIIDDSTKFSTLHNSKIIDIDKDYAVGNYSYVFTNGLTGQVKPATITNGLINVLGKESDSVLQRQMVAPVNIEQKLASRAVLDPSIDLVLVEGLAGSGKNTVVTSSAVRLLQTNKNIYDGIVYIRSPQNDEDAGEDIGYLAGNDEKFAVYLGPMDDTLSFLVSNNLNTKGKTAKEVEEKIATGVDKLVEDCGIISIITTGLRGRTFHNKIVIIDEATNLSPATMQKVLTRVGKNCKVIVIGSQLQIDSKYVTKYNNGMAVLLEEAYTNSLDSEIKMFAIELTKVKRSPTVEFAERLFSK